MVATVGTAMKQRMIPNMRHNIAVAEFICVDWGRKFIRTPLIRLHVTAGLQRPRDEARTVCRIAPCPVYQVTVRHSTNPLRHTSLQLTQRHTSRGCPHNDQFKDSENHFLWNSHVTFVEALMVVGTYPIRVWIPYRYSYILQHTCTR